MKYDALQGAEKYTKAHRRKKRWYRVVTSLACVVVFCTTYALILPAITLENTGCEIPEHTHVQECYTQVTSVSHTEPVCTIEGLNIHQHDNTCYDSEGNLICRYANFVVHRHDSACFDKDGNLWCTLPEIEVHQHTDSCYTQPGVHEHTADCYTLEQRELTCVEHIHTENCYVQSRHLTCGREESEGHHHNETCMVEKSVIQCGLEESAGHQHSESCMGENSEIQCGIAESQGHFHTESCMGVILEAQCGIAESEGHHHDDNCYEPTQELVCEIESDHQHTDACYAWEQVLICEISTQPDEPVDPVLICEKPEVILHTHLPYVSAEDPGCFDEYGNLTCSQIQILEHQHTDACFKTVEESADTEALTCTLPEDENHTHGPLCYGTWELTCGMEEHTHTAACFSDADADVETAQEWEQTFADVRLTGEWPVDVIAIAKTQLGYTESTKNYTVWEDGSQHGYTRYGEWYGSPYGDWCAMFASFCIHYADVEGMPLNWGCRTWIADLEQLELYCPADSEDPPRVGDLVFYDWEQDGLSDHVGLVAELTPASGEEPAKLIAIEGNSSNQVRYVTYDLDDPVILGYGKLPEQTFYCGKAGHVHTSECGSACSLEEHIHTDSCGIPDVEETPTELSYEGPDYTVTVQYGADAALPEGVTLEVLEIPGDCEEYQHYLSQAAAAMENAGQTETVVFARFFDIRFLLEGETLEPAAPVSVTITYTEAVDTAEDRNCQAIHFAEAGTEILNVTTEQKEDGSTSFTHTQNGFSVVGNVVTQAEVTYADAPTAGLDHNVTFMVKIRDNWVKVGSCTYDTSAVGGRAASVSSDVLHQYLDNYGYGTETNPAGTLKCSYDDIYTIYYAQNGAATSSAVDIEAGNISEGAYLHLWQVLGQDSQSFRIWRVVDNYYFITPLSNSGLHLNLENGATDNGTHLWLHRALDEASWWGIRNNDDGTVSFYSQKKSSAYIDLTANNQSDGTVIALYEGGEANRWKLVQKYDEQDVAADNDRVGLTAESNGNIVCFYTPSNPLNDPNAIYTAEELSKLGTSGSYYLGCDITIDHVNGSAAGIGDGVSTMLDLNGHTIHYNVPADDSGSSMVYLHGTGSLTITDSGEAVETTEVVTDRPLYGNLASYDSSTKTLVYYVTVSSPNGDGTTTETLVKHTVDLTNVGAVESDTEPYHLIYVANDAVLNIEGGRYTNANGKRAITAYDNCSVNIKGGYLCGCMNYGNEIIGGAVHVNSTGELNISGGVIAANRADKAGGVYKNNGTFSMTGGVISGNQVPDNANNGTDCRGGGVQIDNAETTISGGYITNNRLDYKCDAVGNGCHFGGGVTFYNATMNISNNCYITGNYSAEAGGGIGFAGQQFIMTGGTVAANVAQTAEGGGIRIQDSGQTSLITGGYITNNRTNSMHDWGGGGIFVCQGQSLQILNAVFQKNRADGFGGGVGGCSTGQIVAVDNTVGGVAIFDNYAYGRTMSGSDGVANSKQDDLTAQSNEVFMTNGYNDFFCALNSAVSGTMLGNGAENWHGSRDYEAIDIGKNQIETANQMMGLNASPADADKQTAIRKGTVFVSGNYSQTHGGGIMSNGILILGQATDISLSPGLEIEVYKAFKDKNGNTLDLQAGQFQFLLQDANHNTIATVSNNAYGMVLAGQDYTEARTYTYYLKEQIPAGESLITYDGTEYQITVTVGTDIKKLNLSANQSMTITYYVVTDIQVSLSSGTGTASTATSNVGSNNHRATVVIKKDGGTAFTNTMNEKPLYFRITKLNGHTNEPLQFVEFTLKDEYGNVITSGKTDKDGHVSLQIEKDKSYRLYETTFQNFMPAGPWILEVDADGNVMIYNTTTGADGSISKSGTGTACTKEEKDVAVYYDHTITNLIGGYELPDTGGAGTTLYTIGGLLLMAAAGFFLLYNHTKRRRENAPSS